MDSLSLSPQTNPARQAARARTNNRQSKQTATGNGDLDDPSQNRACKSRPIQHKA